MGDKDGSAGPVEVVRYVNTESNDQSVQLVGDYLSALMVGKNHIVSPVGGVRYASTIEEYQTVGSAVEVISASTINREELVLFAIP